MARLTTPNATTALVNLNLEAVALCGEGANSRAHIVLTKRKENTNMTFDELMKALKPEQAEVVTKHLNDLVASKDGEIVKLNDQVTSLTGEVTDLKKTKPAPAAQEDVLKSASPEIKALVEKLQGTVSGLVAAQEETLAAERYAKVKALPVEEDALKSVLKSASPAVIEILEKAAAAIEKGLAPKGMAADGNVAGTSADDCYAKLEKAARALMTDAASAGMSFEKAFTVACEKDPETYKNYVKGAN